MTAQAFFESHRDAGKMLGESAHAVDGAAVFVETLFSMMPRPRHPPLYYGTLLFDLSELLEATLRLLERALHRLVARLPDLDAELQLRLAEWLKYSCGWSARGAQCAERPLWPPEVRVGYCVSNLG